MIAAFKNKRFLVFGGAALFCVLFLAGTVMVHARQYVALYAQHTAATQQIKELRSAIQGVDPVTLQKENAALAAELSEIERSLPEADYVPTLIRQIESGAALTGNDLVELRQGQIRKGMVAAAPGAEAEAPDTATAGTDEAGTETPQGQRYDEMDIELRFDGSYRGAFNFIKYLGRIGKIIAVEGVEIEKAGPDEVRPDGQSAARVRIQAKAYILAPRTGFPGEVTIKVY